MELYVCCATVFEAACGTAHRDTRVALAAQVLTVH